MRAPDARAAHEAAQWLVRQQTGHSDAAALARWRAADPQHELAWQRAETVMHQLGLVNGPLAASALREAGQAGRRAALRTLAVLIAAGPAAWSAYKLAPWASWSADERTATGETRRLTLADGSRLQIDTASAVDIRFDAQARRLVLQAGALWVQTAPDAAGRPFLVQTAQGRARALGTRFTVRLLGAAADQPAATQVAVLDGAVELQPLHGPAQRVNAGQQAWMSEDAGSAAEPLQADADGWTQGVLYAENMPLGAFAAELGRYRPGLLRCDPAVAQLRVSGAFQLTDTDAALTALVASLPVRVELRTRYWATIAPR